MCGRGSRACWGTIKFDFEWISLYKFQCRRMEKFLHGRVIFAGDAAHQVSPFGARGANSGLEDAENLAWKLDRVLRRTSPESLLDSYHVERSAAADENIRESTRSTDFMAPVSHQEARLRKAVLSLAKETEFGKRMINGGRLSVPSVYDTPLSTADGDDWRGGPRPGASMLGCAACRHCRRRYISDRSLHQGGNVLHAAGIQQWRCRRSAGWCRGDPDRRGGTAFPIPRAWRGRATTPNRAPAYLLRPDGYVAARFRQPTRAALDAALARATGSELR